MSLQVWLPFTDGTLKQQGLSGATVSSGGTVSLANAGKLGKCATFTSTAGGLTIPPSTMTGFTTACSVSFWLKINAWGSSYDTYFQAGTGSTPWAAYIFGFLRNGTNSTICFTIGNSSSASNNSYLTSALSLNTWYHIALTYETGKCRIYLNGALDHEYTTSIVPAFDKITKISVGRSNSDGAYQTQCNMNDLRIYDHCLSPMEIKRISQGLVLHYPLDRRGFGQENLFSYQNKGSGIIVLNDYQNTGSFTQFYNCLTFDPAKTIGTVYTISFWARSPNGTTQLNLYNSNGNPAAFRFYTNLTTNLGTEWRYFTYTFTNQSYSDGNSNYNNRIEIYMNNKMKGEVKQIKIEVGNKATPWCPASIDSSYTTMGLNSTIEYDCSGFCNNGEKIGALTYTNNTSKYAVSTHIGATSQKIHISNFSVNGFGNSYSFAWWGKRTSNSPMFWGFSDGCRLNGMYVGIYWNTGDGSSNPIYTPGTTTTITAPSVNVWHHYVMTGDGTTCKLYVDGVLYGQAKTYKAISGTSIYINGWDSSTSYCSDNTDISDFRIYATALSAADVLELYKSHK